MSRKEMIKYVLSVRPDVKPIIVQNMSIKSLEGLCELEQHRIDHEINEELVDQF
ncbi:hypothetical protein [Loigolactobacillus backii]|uniref:hypothetical protein n=1 Tax=Loigolactobacillus backii TaxID=375175 RepID=UPI00130473AD|nr:hypothetical protein [Loigolactobacillus backii]